MKKRHYILMFAFVCSFMTGKAQNYPHYTMFMYNKMLYNPGYVGNKNLTTINCYYRKQWVGIKGEPTSFSATIDGAIGNYMKSFRPVALGLTVTNETAGVTSTTNLMGYYAYRIKTSTKGVLSMGLSGGASFYNADYSKLNPYQEDDPNLQEDVQNRIMPNVGVGAYYSTNHYYIGASIPYLLENQYDNTNENISGDSEGKQIRTYFLSGGYVFTISQSLKLQPQILIRYAANKEQKLKPNADFNVMAFFFDRIAIGSSFRTDKSIEGIIFGKVSKSITCGFSMDFSTTDIKEYNNGTYEVTLGYDIIRDHKKYVNPRFIRYF